MPRVVRDEVSPVPEEAPEFGQRFRSSVVADVLRLVRLQEDQAGAKYAEAFEDERLGSLDVDVEDVLRYEKDRRVAAEFVRPRATSK